MVAGIGIVGTNLVVKVSFIRGQYSTYLYSESRFVSQEDSTYIILSNSIL